MVEYTPPFQKALDEVQKIDPSLKSVIETHQFPSFLANATKRESTYEYLVRSVISQQLNGTAAAKIRDRFINIFGHFPSPKEASKCTIEQLREIGFSQRKAEYVIGLAEIYERKELYDEIFDNKTDEEVTGLIVKVRGLGPWTAQMFLIFCLNRMNVFSTGDLGVQRGLINYVSERPELNISIPKGKRKVSVSPKLMEKVASKFEPYRTAFQMILWKLSDIQMDTVEARDKEMQNDSNKKRKTK